LLAARVVAEGERRIARHRDVTASLKRGTPASGYAQTRKMYCGAVRVVVVVARWDRVWPPAALGMAPAINLVWVGLLGHGLVRLV